jgi:hypothetical protein
MQPLVILPGGHATPGGHEQIVNKTCKHSAAFQAKP